MNAHLTTPRGRRRSLQVLLTSGLLAVGLGACGATGGGTSDAGSRADQPATSTAPATGSTASPETETTTEEGTTAPAQEVVITISDFEYDVPDTVPSGATVTVVNEDRQAHTVTAKGMFDVNVGPGETGEFTAPEEAGEYDFICLFHGNMNGTLVVS